MPARRLLAFALLNVIVSASVVLAILFWWDSRKPETPEANDQVLIVPTAPLVAAVVQEDVEPATGDESQEEDESDLPMYTVQAGDTLGKISRDFDVSIEDIMTANGIDDPNFLQVGQALIIPVGGIPTPTLLPEDTITPDVTPTPISAELPTDGEAVIDIANVLNAGNLEDEAVSIINTGSRPMALLGWRLTDEDGRTYTFGQVTLFGEGAAITIHTGSGQEGPSDLYWGFNEAIWQQGETATLLDAEGTVRATYLVGSQ